MLILGIDTSTRVSSIALVESRELLGEIKIDRYANHSSKLIPCLRFLMNNCDIKINDIDCIAISIGPGSFTGLRVGLASVKGLAIVNKIPVVAVNTLKALAYSFKGSKYLIAPILDAKEKRIYFALYNSSSEDLIEVIPPKRILIEEFLTSFPEDENIIFTGNGCNIHHEKIRECLGDRAHFAEMDRNSASAVAIALLGFEKIEEGKYENLALVEPLYMKEFEVKT